MGSRPELFVPGWNYCSGRNYLFFFVRISKKENLKLEFTLLSNFLGILFLSIQVKLKLLFLMIPILRFSVSLCFLKLVSTKFMIQFPSFPLILKKLSLNLCLFKFQTKCFLSLVVTWSFFQYIKNTILLGISKWKGALYFFLLVQTEVFWIRVNSPIHRMWL